jgi:3-dehydroquinate dehydratase-2
MKKNVILNGPNLNMIGVREKNIYGKTNYAELCQKLESEAKELKVDLEIFQSNSEGNLVDKIQSLLGKADIMIVNAGAYTHTSIAIRDALAAVQVPFIELHISNVYSREEFRAHSYISPLASGILAGFGTEGYSIALKAAAGYTIGKNA